MVLSEKTLIRRMSNKDLINTINTIRKEKADPATYGRGGTSRWVTSSEFWRGHHQDLKAELKRRQTAGNVRKTAGKPTRRSTSHFGNIKIRMPKF